MSGLSVTKRRGESDEALVRRFLRKQRNSKLMDELKDPVNGCPQCRNVSKRSLKKRHKEIKAAARRRREAYQALKRQRKREARMNKMRR